ncbi:hypothetical protein M0R19_02315 [Candidatus Pacearchaeota archaeon]|jgi:hypothetical protein|nr:hypothetical protein [Candidatus Pacearchaeota archaeon]
MGDGLTITKLEKNLIGASYEEYFDRNTGERDCISGKFDKKEYFEGIKKFNNAGKCEIEGINGTKMIICRLPGKDLISITLSSGNISVNQTVSSKELSLE